MSRSNIPKALTISAGVSLLLGTLAAFLTDGMGIGLVILIFPVTLMVVLTRLNQKDRRH